MKFKHVVASVVVMFGVSAASAVTSLDIGPAIVTYDDTTSFGFLASTFSSPTTYGFTWAVPGSAQVQGFGPLTVVNVPLPSFMITGKAGWALSGASAFLAGLDYIEPLGGATNIVVNGNISPDGGPAWPIGPRSVNRVQTFVLPLSFSRGGYFAGTFAPPGAFSSVTVTGAGIDLSATDLASITANPQSKLEISFTAVPVPEPKIYAMMLIGLAAMGLMLQRRRGQG